MVRIFLVLAAACMLTACVPKVAIKEKVVEKDVPVYVIPKLPDVGPKPVLEISKLTPADKTDLNKEVAALVISLQQVIDYSGNLLLVYNNVQALSDSAIPLSNVDPKAVKGLNMENIKAFFEKYGVKPKQ